MNQYSELSREIRGHKRYIKHRQRRGLGIRKETIQLRILSNKAKSMMEHTRRSKELRKQLLDHIVQFPIEVSAKTVDVHFNRISNEFSFMPMWTIRAKGKSYYVHHVDISCPFSTRETDGSTRGMLRFKNCNLVIDPSGNAIIQEQNQDVGNFHQQDYETTFQERGHHESL